MLASTHVFANGMIETFSATGSVTLANAAEGGEGQDLFGRFVSVYQSNEFLFSELKSVQQKLTHARSYLESPGSNPLLARAQVDHLKARHSAVLTLLRANRLQARTLLFRVEPAAEADVA